MAHGFTNPCSTTFSARSSDTLFLRAMQTGFSSFQASVDDRVAVRGFQQTLASPIKDKEAKQDFVGLQSPSVPQSALAARLKDPLSPAAELKDARNSGSVEAPAPADKNKVAR